MNNLTNGVGESDSNSLFIQHLRDFGPLILSIKLRSLMERSLELGVVSVTQLFVALQ